MIMLSLVLLAISADYTLQLKPGGLNLGTATIDAGDTSFSYTANNIPWEATTPKGAVRGYSDSTVAFTDGSNGILQDTVPMYVVNSENVLVDSANILIWVYPKYELFDISDTTLKVYELETIQIIPTVTPTP